MKLEQKSDQSDKDDNDKTSDKRCQWASRRELMDKSSTRLHSLLEYSQLSYWQGQAPSSLATLRSFTELEAFEL